MIKNKNVGQHPDKQSIKNEFFKQFHVKFRKFKKKFDAKNIL